MAPAFHTVALSLVYLLYSACRRAHRSPIPPPDQPPDGDEQVEHRLDCLTMLVKPLPRRRS